MLRTGLLLTGHEPRTESLTTCSSVIAWNKIASKRYVLEPYKHNNDYAIPVCKKAINTDEFKERIKAFPCNALHCDEHQNQGNTTQYGSLHLILS